LKTGCGRRTIRLMNNFKANDYGPFLRPLLDLDRRRPLGAGRVNPRLRERLNSTTMEAAFAHVTVVDLEMAGCCLSGLWLLHDFLDEAHTACHDIDTPSGSYWHALVHRREGDFVNSKYWFDRVGNHEVFGPLGQRAAELGAARGEGHLITAGQFDPMAFVDLVEGVERGRQLDARELCLDIQQAEWELLFDWCYRRAVRD
jgi:hypothetical protein